MLWPKVQQAVKTGPDREVVKVYPYRSACPSPVWGQLIGDATTDLLFAGYTNYFFFTGQPAFLDTLRARVNAGCRVRFLMGDPEVNVTRQREEIEQVALTVSTRIRITMEELAKLNNPAVEARYAHPQDCTAHVGLSVFRFDDDAMVTPHLARLVGHDSPMMHLRRQQEGGLFDRFVEHSEELWERATPALSPATP